MSNFEVRIKPFTEMFHTASNTLFFFWWPWTHSAIWYCRSSLAVKFLDGTTFALTYPIFTDIFSSCGNCSYVSQLQNYEQENLSHHAWHTCLTWWLYYLLFPHMTCVLCRLRRILLHVQLSFSHSGGTTAGDRNTIPGPELHAAAHSPYYTNSTPTPHRKSDLQTCGGHAFACSLCHPNPATENNLWIPVRGFQSKHICPG